MTGPARASVVVMTRDRWPQLRRSLPHHDVPVVVVDNASRDGTAERVREAFPGVEVVALGANLGAVARNVGVLRAETPYVAFADDDSWWAPGALARACEVMDAHPDLAVLASRTLVGDRGVVDPVSTVMASSPLGRAPDLPGPSVLGFVACGAVVRRSAFLAVGGFDDLLFFLGEEELLALDLADAGWALCYVDEVVSHHDPVAGPGRTGRAAQAARNRVLVAVMRRPWRVVARTVRRELATGSSGRLGVVRALGVLVPALERRRRLDPAVEASLSVLGAVDG